MKLSEFDYYIPQDQIAQHPLGQRDASRLAVLRRADGTLEHCHFRDIADFLEEGDVLVLNNSKVLPVRLYGTRPSGGKAEITLLKEREENTWEALVKGVHEGEIILAEGIRASIIRHNSTVTARFSFQDSQCTSPNSDIRKALPRLGFMPLPLYIKRDAAQEDASSYQTVYAQEEGSVAAPTAGLHFTDPLLEMISNKGVIIRHITLHVGYGTFKPVTAPDIGEHSMDEEHFFIPEEAAKAVNKARGDGRRVIAVGTTVTRVLESAAGNTEKGLVRAGRGTTSLFIRPGHSFKAIDGLITNFHLPRSTPMILAAALSGLDLLKRCYSECGKRGYRFYSYGDAMIIL